MNATYSPEDNKLRIYPSSRLEPAQYALAKEAGFRWAPKQKLFFSTWSTQAEDFALDLCGDIGDEDTSLVERAEERAGRFEEYSDKRLADAHSARNGVAAIADGIPLGQPILIGHHSERRARKDAERIQNGMQKAVNMWRTSEYWSSRAAGALRHAKYKELPGVRARRIKTIEADSRRVQRKKDEAEKRIAFFTDPATEAVRNPKSPYGPSRLDNMTLRCAYLCSYGGGLSLQDQEAVEKGHISENEGIRRAIDNSKSMIAHYERWLDHYANRLSYEKAMLEEQGAGHLIAPQPKRLKFSSTLPICNYKETGELEIWNFHHRRFDKIPQIEMTSGEYAKINKDYKGTDNCEDSHRVRICMDKGRRVCVFLTDSKVHTKPPRGTRPEAKPRPLPVYTPPPVDPEKEEFKNLERALKNGEVVKVVSAPQLFPTPPELAAQMVALADIQPGCRVLEPSAGTGRILDQLHFSVVRVIAVDINPSLVEQLRNRFAMQREDGALSVYRGDFMDMDEDFIGTFDRVVMNPPFEDGQDIRHIQHALGFLKPGGVLVALCANGPRQRAKLMPIVEEEYGGDWMNLPEGSFLSEGTNVNVAMIVIKTEGGAQ